MLICLLLALGWAVEIQPDTVTFYDYHANSIDGNQINMNKYKGKKVLIVNVASKCGFTPQYKELQALYQQYKNKGLCILAFPCNDFANQEPSSNSEIKEFCDCNYGVMFGIFEKIKEAGSSYVGRHLDVSDSSMQVNQLKKILKELQKNDIKIVYLQIRTIGF